MSTVLLTYLGWRKFPRDLSSFEVQQFFSLSQADRYALRRNFRSRSRLGAAIQRGFVRMTGTTLEAFDYIPREVLAYVGKQLRLGSPELATLRALYRRRPTLFEHQSWACKYAGYRWPTADGMKVIADVLLASAAVSLDRQRLAKQAREALFTHGYLIPGNREIVDWVRDVIRSVELADRETINEAVPMAVRDSWLPNLMRAVYPGPMTMIEWLRRPPRRRSTKTLKEELKRFHAVVELSPPSDSILIPPERMNAYARRMRRRRPVKVQAIAEPGRTLELAALLAVMSARQSDNVLRLVEMRIAEIWRWAHSLAQPTSKGPLPEEVARLLASAVEDSTVSDADFRARARVLLAPWAHEIVRRAASRASQVRERLTHDRRRVRPLIKNVIDLGLQGEIGNPLVAALKHLDGCYREACLWLPDSVSRSFATGAAGR